MIPVAIDWWSDKAQLEAILGNLEEGLVLLGPSGKILYMNAAALRIQRLQQLWESKQPIGDVVGSFELYDPGGQHIPADERPLARVLRGESYSDVEVREQDSKTGDVRIMCYSGTLLRKGDAPLGIVTVRDITKRRQAEMDLERRVRQQHILAELGLRALQDVELHALMNEATRRLAEVLQVEYCEVLELLPDGDNLLLKAGVGWQEGLVGRATVGTELASQAGFTLRTKEPVIVEDLRQETRFSGPKLLHDHGVVSGLSVIIFERGQAYGVLEAHTTRKRTFSAEDVYFLQAVANLLGEAIARQRLLGMLRESETGFRQLFKDNPQPMWVYDHNTFSLLEVNSAAERHYGYVREEFLQMRFFDLLPPEEAARLLEKSQQGKSAFTRPSTWRHQRKAGQTIVVEMVGHPLEFNFNGYDAVLVVVRDITAQKEAEDRFAKAFHASPTAISIARLGDLKFIDVNQAFIELTGYQYDELVGHTAREVGLDFEMEKREQVLKRLSKDQPLPQLELDIKTKTGEKRHVLVGTEVIKLDHVPCLLDTFIDITQRKQTEEQLMQAIQTVMQDAASLSRSVMEQLTLSKSPTGAGAGLTELTRRERQVLELLAKGLNNDVISSELGLTKQTVRNYISRIYDKIRVHSRAEAVVWARERGLVNL